ncbi:hypothetical protein [Streptomyces sp. NTH33]|uniref:hypothetical protein n=1 Tax=Streptomyces sp. NTH33 TaxID=1735453 RepID=UPI0021ABEAE7|nr:hypothetical protein [Streptomyces sp. NTH33]
MANVFSQLPAVLAADLAEQAADVVAHPPTRFDAPETVAGAQKEFFEFTVPGLGCTLVDHHRRLPGPVSLPAAAAHDGGAVHEDRP